jgi:hypothetical protein
MAFDEGLAHRIRDALHSRHDVEEKKMFGGLCFLVRGHMAFGIVKDELMLRTGPDAYQEALARPHAREMTFTGKPMRGMIYVGVDGFAEDDELRSWLDVGLEFNSSMEAKNAAAKKKKKKKAAAKKKKKAAPKKKKKAAPKKKKKAAPKKKKAAPKKKKKKAAPKKKKAAPKKKKRAAAKKKKGR